MELQFTQGWSSFTRRIFINKNVQEVYKAWAVAAELEKWFFETADYLDNTGKAISKTDYVQSGHTSNWKWHGWPHVHTGKII